MTMSELYLKGEDSYWSEIIRMINYQKMKGLPDFWLVMNLLENIMNQDNEQEIKKIVLELKKEIKEDSKKNRIEEIENIEFMEKEKMEKKI